MKLTNTQKLLTLKEIDCTDADHPLLCREDGCTCYKSDLRAEAVKFLKLAEKYETDYICLQPPKELEQFNSNKDFPFKLKPGIRQYIIWKNNLTEEDLA